MRKEFSPFPSTSHVIYDTTAEGFVFMSGVGGVEDAVFFMLQRDASKTLCTGLTVVQIIALHTSPGIRTKAYIICWEWAQTFKRPLSGCIITIIRIFGSPTCRYIPKFFSLCIIET